jgi:hypothetical protein
MTPRGITENALADARRRRATICDAAKTQLGWMSAALDEAKATEARIQAEIFRTKQDLKSNVQAIDAEIQRLEQLLTPPTGA